MSCLALRPAEAAIYPRNAQTPSMMRNRPDLAGNALRWCGYRLLQIRKTVRRTNSIGG
jgi:hypothetical protein